MKLNMGNWGLCAVVLATIGIGCQMATAQEDPSRAALAEQALDTAAKNKILKPASPLMEKACVFAAAQQLPPIPALGLTSSRVTTADLFHVIDTMTDQYLAIGTAGASLETFATVTVELGQKLKLGGSNPDARRLLRRAVTLAIEGVAEVEIDVRAAGRDGTYSFYCAWNARGATYLTKYWLAR